MNVGRFVVGIFGVVLLLGCVAKQPLAIGEEERSVFAENELDSVLIANKESEYEIVIIEPGFYNWLITIARPEGYYSQTFLENRNQVFVTNWNNRVLLPAQYDSRLYVLPIDYDPKEDYGYEVNYKLYNYFIYFQRRYNQRLGPWVPRL
ncbi:hypothetical protein SAMN04490243_1792 [Robiginitalea myxolifaciens]|uniref:Lipoprotein n=1 Tax=Robiginitalea myxolifaciens TaxID=400055 RepID=A0A1I6GW26_9FLAO|nr:DUF6146 family protein [Robiginitalea myxolifaciens]SFR46289.1 hypothetical protein SAMN04490243_1792 [Robiginitalea myxolifaciens]